MQTALLDSNNVSYGYDSLPSCLEHGNANEKSEYSKIQVSINQHIEQIKKNNKDIRAFIETPINNKSDKLFIDMYKHIETTRFVGPITGTLLIECFTARVLENDNLIKAVLLGTKNTDTSNFNNKQYGLATNLRFNLEYSKLFIPHHKFNKTIMNNTCVRNFSNDTFESWEEHIKYRENWLRNIITKIESFNKSQYPWKKAAKRIFKLVKN